MNTYVWCEDSGSGLELWNEIFKTLHPNIVVQTKKNNSRLRKDACAVANDGNTYFILIDSFVDNADVLREIDKLKKGTSEKENVSIVDIRSFEFALLSFTLLEQWVFAEDDWLKEKRQELLKARELFVKLQTQGGDAAELAQLRVLFPYLQGHNLEQSSAELLYQITRNTGFETDKRKLGECFIADCCKWASRQADDLCGLDHTRLLSDEKKKLLVSCSILKTAFEKAGL